MSILKVGVLAVAGVLLAVQFKNGKTEYSTYISVVLGILIFGGILGYLEILIHAFDKLEEDLDLDYAYVAILLKMLGITYVSELVSAICKDAGYQSVALQIEIFARLGIMVLCIPILMTLLDRSPTVSLGRMPPCLCLIYFGKPFPFINPGRICTRCGS